MPVAEAPAASLSQDLRFAIFGKVKKDLARLGILCHRPQGHFQDFILAVGTSLKSASARLAVFGNDMLAVLKVQERPQLRIRPKDDVASASAVAAIRPAFCRPLVAVQVG